MTNSFNNIKITSSNLKNLHVLVVGDLMLDVYQSGDVNRISPEAPVPIVDVENSFERLGGASNVCLNIASLNAKCSVIGMVGNDEAGNKMKHLFDKSGINSDQIIISNTRPTTTKTRIIANNQQVVRIDKENKSEIHKLEEEQILLNFRKIIKDVDVVILQDYNKGLLTKKLIQNLIKCSNNNSKPVFVDPKFDNFFSYKNVFLFKPNKKEAEQTLGVSFNNIENIKSGAITIKNKLNCENVLITLGEDGMLLLTNENRFLQIPTKAKKVHDVSGAGDTVISTLALFFTANYPLKQSVSIANIAAGIICESIGVTPIKLNDLKNRITNEK